METALHYFYETVVAGSMTRASEKLGVAPSSISRQVAQLEGQLGIALIERGRRSLKMTEAGEIAFKYYQDHIRALETFRSSIDDLRGVRAGVVCIAVGEGFLSPAFSLFLTEFSALHPGVHVAVRVGSTSQVVRWILDDEAHLGLVLQFPPAPDIRIRASAIQPLVAIVSPAHPLAQQTFVTLDELSAHSLCLGPKDFRIRQFIMAAAVAESVTLKPTITTNSLLQMKQMVTSGNMVTILPALAGAAEFATGELVGLPILSSTLEVPTTALVTRLGRQLPTAAGLLLSRSEARMRAWDKEAQRLLNKLKPAD